MIGIRFSTPNTMRIWFVTGKHLGDPMEEQSSRKVRCALLFQSQFTVAAALRARRIPFEFR